MDDINRVNNLDDRNGLLAVQHIICESQPLEQCTDHHVVSDIRIGDLQRSTRYIRFQLQVH